METSPQPVHEARSVSIEPITVRMPHRVWNDMVAYAVVSRRNEVNGFGFVDYDPQTSLDATVTSVFIADQEVTGVQANMTAEQSAALTMSCINGGVDISRMRLQWHSHVDMDAYFSKTDTDNIERMIGLTPWMLSIVINKRGEYEARLDVKAPRITVPVHIVLTELPGPTPLQMRIAESEIAAKVQTASLAHRRGGWFGGTQPVPQTYGRRVHVGGQGSTSAGAYHD